MPRTTRTTSQREAVKTPCRESRSPVFRAERHETTGPIIFFVAGDKDIRDVITVILEEGGYTVLSFSDAAALFRDFHPGDADCLVVDERLPGKSGVEIISLVRSIDPELPAILVTAKATLEVSVRAMRAGAVDFIQKPFQSKLFCESIETALSNARRRQPYAVHIAKRAFTDFHFTKRQHQILELVLDGQPSKIIAADLGISLRTVESHRAAIMKKTGSKSIPGLVRATIAVASAIWLPNATLPSLYESSCDDRQRPITTPWV